MTIGPFAWTKAFGIVAVAKRKSEWGAAVALGGGLQVRSSTQIPAFLELFWPVSAATVVVTVRLPPGGAVLSGTVRDRSDGKPVKGIFVQYQAVDGKASGSSRVASDGEFHVNLPPDCDLVIIVSAKRL